MIYDRTIVVQIYTNQTMCMSLPICQYTHFSHILSWLRLLETRSECTITLRSRGACKLQLIYPPPPPRCSSQLTCLSDTCVALLSVRLSVARLILTIFFFQEWMLAEIMSEVTDAPVIIQPAKSEDKLEIEKEEAGETTEKAEEELGEKAAESAEKAAESDEKVAEAEDGGKTEEKPASEDVESSDVTEKEKKEEEGGDKVEGASEEQKDSDDVGEGGEKKKFSLSQIKTPKIIKEIRSRSKSREKKKVSSDIS